MNTIEDIALEDLPPTVQLLIEIMGLPATLVFVYSFGGESHFYIPKPSNMNADHRIVQAVGTPAANKLAAHFNGDFINNIPACKMALLQLRDQQVCQRYEQGEKPKSMYADYDVSERRIWQILQKNNTTISNNKQTRLVF